MSPNEVKEALKFSYYINDSVMIEGFHGIGKTSVVKQSAKELDLNYIELILSLKDPSDLIGMPDKIYDDIDGYTSWLQSDWLKEVVDSAWPLNFEFSDLEFNDKQFEQYVIEFNNNESLNRNKLNDLYIAFYKEKNKTKNYLITNQMNVSCKLSKQSILFLDELNRAAQETRQCGLQLVLEKRLHNHILPHVKGKPTFIISAINPTDSEEIDYQAFELDYALADRFTLIKMSVSINDFIEYGKTKSLNKIVLDYLMKNQDQLWKMEKNSTAGATPRSWEVVSNMIDALNTYTISENILLNLIIGRLGNTIAYSFMSYLKTHKNMISEEDIIELVNENTNKSIDQITKILKDFSKEKDLETIKIKDLFNNLYIMSEKFIDKEPNIIVKSMMCWLYSMNLEVSTGLLKDLKAKRDSEKCTIFDNIFKCDNLLNDRKFFKELIKYMN